MMTGIANEEACPTCMRNVKGEGAFWKRDEPEPPKEGASLRYMMNWNLQKRGHVYDMW